MSKKVLGEIANLALRVVYLEGRVSTLSKQLGKVDALAQALGYQFIILDTGEMFVFGNTYMAIKKEMLDADGV